MRYIGLDLGSKTVGIAVSEGGIIATALETYRFSDNDLQSALKYVKIVVATKRPDKIVMGLPKNMDGSLGFQSEYVLKFKEMLEQETDKEVILYDERLSSMEVNKMMISADVSRGKRKQRVDTLAATLILQSYLDCKKF